MEPVFWCKVYWDEIKEAEKLLSRKLTEKERIDKYEDICFRAAAEEDVYVYSD